MILAIWGKEKSGKSSLAMTFPQPTVIYDFDLGSHRALYRFQGEHIEIKPYAVPLQFGTLMKGVRELWEKFVQDYSNDLQKEAVKTVVIDSATQLWLVVRHAYLQGKQEAAKPKEKKRERLLPIEYAMPNNRMETIIYAARSFGKNLALTHYSRDVYQDKLTDTGYKSIRTGEIELDGFRYTTGLVDMVVQTYVEYDEADNPAFKALVTTSGLSPYMKGMAFENPTYELLVGAVEKTRVIPL